MKKNLFVLALFALLLANLNCEVTACTDAGCGPVYALTANFEDESKIQPGDYSLTVETDAGDSIVHQFTVTQEALDKRFIDKFENATINGDSYFDTDENKLYIDVHQLKHTKKATTIRFRLERMGEVLMDETLDLDFETFYPNGEDCNSCQTDSETINI